MFDKSIDIGSKITIMYASHFSLMVSQINRIGEEHDTDTILEGQRPVGSDDSSVRLGDLQPQAPDESPSDEAIDFARDLLPAAKRVMFRDGTPPSDMQTAQLLVALCEAQDDLAVFIEISQTDREEAKVLAREIKEHGLVNIVGFLRMARQAFQATLGAKKGLQSA